MTATHEPTPSESETEDTSAPDAPGEQRRLDEYLTEASNRCQAIAVSTGERCEHEALPGTSFCAFHH